MNNKTHKIAAIVPAYNESAHIARVLETLSNTDVLDEIIVVDDASSDDTPEIVENFRRVKLFRNEKNMGKAYSLRRAIDSTDADTLFFCDADLNNLTPGIITQIIEPVIEGRYDMYIGVRNNLMQKAITLFALNSGERALTRDLWEKMPEVFKYRYRVEAGLNFTAKTHGKGYGWRKFNYYQTLKEKKYGFVKGTILRWWMNLDVLYAYIASMFERRKKSN